MNPDQVPTNTEAELESFRQKWREEVTAKTKGKAPTKTSTASSSRPHVTKRNSLDAGPLPQPHARQKSIELAEDVTPYEYPDLGEKQHGRRLDETSAQTAAALAATREPSSALEYYEKAVEREDQGNLGDSVNLYRKAYKLDVKVHETYQAKHFPPSYFKKPAPPIPGPSSSDGTIKPNDPNPSNASPTVPNTAHHSLQGLSSSLQSLISDFSGLSIVGAPPPTEFSPPPPCPISMMPEEILEQILEQLAVQDLASFARLAQVCKRLAYLVVTEDRVWKRIALGDEYGFAGMHYSFTCRINGEPLGDDGEGGFIVGGLGSNSGTATPSSTEEEFQAPLITPSPLALTPLLIPSVYPTYRALFRLRPRIRFNGCYISTVNYTRAGQASPTSVSWNSPIHIVTYYRYLRFLRDGTCISLLTTSEPTDVVPLLWIEHLGSTSGPMKDAVLGRWRLSGPDVPTLPLPRPSTTSQPTSTSTILPPTTLTSGSPSSEVEKEGTLIIETPGATPKYINKMALSISGGSRSAKNTKLSWQGYWSYNRLTDDWGEYFLKNDRNRAFWWSRVKSFGMGWEERGIKEV